MADESSSRPPCSLAGLRLGVKDNIDVAGLPTTAGCPAFAYEPADDAPVVAPPRAGRRGGRRARPTSTSSPPAWSAPAARTARWRARSRPGTSRAARPAARRSPWPSGEVDAALGTDTAGSGRVPAALLRDRRPEADPRAGCRPRASCPPADRSTACRCSPRRGDGGRGVGRGGGRLRPDGPVARPRPRRRGPSRRLGRPSTATRWRRVPPGSWRPSRPAWPLGVRGRRGGPRRLPRGRRRSSTAAPSWPSATPRSAPFVAAHLDEVDPIVGRDHRRRGRRPGAATSPPTSTGWPASGGAAEAAVGRRRRRRRAHRAPPPHPGRGGRRSARRERRARPLHQRRQPRSTGAPPPSRSAPATTASPTASRCSAPPGATTPSGAPPRTLIGQPPAGAAADDPHPTRGRAAPTSRASRSTTSSRPRRPPRAPAPPPRPRTGWWRSPPSRPSPASSASAPRGRRRRSRSRCGRSTPPPSAPSSPPSRPRSSSAPSSWPTAPRSTGFLCEPHATVGAPDITAFGGGGRGGLASHRRGRSSPAPFTTVQDCPGRLGYWMVGVPPSGADGRPVVPARQPRASATAEGARRARVHAHRAGAAVHPAPRSSA